MGITDLFATIAKKSPQVYKPIKDWTIYSGKRFAIDVSMMMHAYSYHVDDNDSSYVHNFINYSKKLATFNITPIYVFDGVAPAAKKQETERRMQQQMNLKRKIVESGENLEKLKQVVRDVKKTRKSPEKSCKEEDPVTFISTLFHPTLVTYHPNPVISTPPTVESVSKMSDWEMQCLIQVQQDKIVQMNKCKRKVRSEHFSMLKKLLAENGLAYVQAPGEGEKECVKMCLENLADVVVSNDSDCLPLGAPILIRNILSTNPKFPPTEVCVADVLKAWGWTKEMFLDYCILCGSDFNRDHIPTLGPQSAFKFISQYRNLESFLKSMHIAKYDIPYKKKYGAPLKDWDYQAIRSEFAIQ